jgi:predicted NBD/HSP70 family sugar kinase
VFSGHGAVLAVDIGGTNIRAGLIELNLKKAKNLSAARVSISDLWRHADDEPSRDKAVERIAQMLRPLIERADKDGLALAPFVGIGCPGLIRDDGSIERGGQNLPGNWEAKKFNLPERIRELIPAIGGHETCVVMHNDAVVQGLSEVPFMMKVPHWGILTIGTGLGNAHFSVRERHKKSKTSPIPLTATDPQSRRWGNYRVLRRGVPLASPLLVPLVLGPGRHPRNFTRAWSY